MDSLLRERRTLLQPEGSAHAALQVMSQTGLRNSNMADATPSGRVGLAQVSRSNQLKSNQVQVPIQNALTSHEIGGACWAKFGHNTWGHESKV